MFACPSWTVNCQTRVPVSYINKHLGLVQGLVSTLFSTGMAAIAYAVYQLGEAALWPILAVRSLRFTDIDKYLSASRGSIISLPLALWRSRTGQPMLVMACVAMVTLVSQANNVIVGYAFTRQNVTTEYQSVINYGGGLGLPFVFDPLAPLPVGVASASSLYASWSRSLSQEPMPDQRDFLVDRTKLSFIGNISISAIKAEKKIVCTGRPLEIAEDVAGDIRCTAATFQVLTNGNRSVAVRLQPQMAVWVDNISYMSATRTISTLVFAAVNGSIEGGEMTATTSRMRGCSYQSISAVACNVDVTLIDDSFIVGDGGPSFATASSLETLNGPAAHHSPYGPLGDLAAWLGVAIVTFGTSIEGTQPMFQVNDPYPLVYTSTLTATEGNTWTLQGLQEFVEVGSGAVGLTMMWQWIQANSTVDSILPTMRLKTWRSFLLLLPPSVVLLMVVLLAILAIRMHAATGVPVMRLALTSEVIKSTHNSEMDSVVQDARLGKNAVAKLDLLKVKYGMVSEGHDGLGTEDAVTAFSCVTYGE